MNYHHTKHTKLTGSTGLKFKLNVQQGFTGDSDSKESAYNGGDPDLILGSGRFSEKRMATHSSILA